MFNVWVFGLGSCALSTILILKTFLDHKMFFPAVIQLCSTNYLASLVSTFVFLVYLFGKLLQAMFFGTLRTIEVEVLSAYIAPLRAFVVLRYGHLFGFDNIS